MSMSPPALFAERPTETILRPDRVSMDGSEKHDRKPLVYMLGLFLVVAPARNSSPPQNGKVTAVSQISIPGGPKGQTSGAAYP
jgi:hypothetical protein